MNQLSPSRTSHLSRRGDAAAAETVQLPPELWDPSRPLAESRQYTNFQNFCRQRVMARFQRLQDGRLEIRQGDHAEMLGCPTAPDGAVIALHHPDFFRRVLWGGTIGAADSYISGGWSTNDLTGLIRILVRNMQQVGGLERTWGRLRRLPRWLQHQFRRNTRAGSRRNIERHYDLGNDFYEVFLDPTMNYSSGIFGPGAQSMHAASLAKMDRICRKLRLRPDDHVLEIGTGWGGLAIYMAEHYGCRVTTTTISREQFRYATQKVRELGLQDRVEVLLRDYRDLDGCYDKLVSIEMIEAVGHQYFDQFFGTCSARLKPDGLMLIQAITIGEQHYPQYIRSVDFIRSHVFPGGCLPSISAMSESLGRVTNLRLGHVEDFTSHYAETLRMWRNAFLNRIDRIRELGYDQAFIRLWHFYLCYCEAGFEERRIHLSQLIFAKPNSRFEPVVDFGV